VIVDISFRVLIRFKTAPGRPIKNVNVRLSIDLTLIRCGSQALGLVDGRLVLAFKQDFAPLHVDVIQILELRILFSAEYFIAFGLTECEESLVQRLLLSLKAVLKRVLLSSQHFSIHRNRQLP